MEKKPPINDNNAPSGIFDIYSRWNGEEYVDLENPENSRGTCQIISDDSSEFYGSINEGFEGEIDPISGEYKRNPSDPTTEL